MATRLTWTAKQPLSGSRRGWEVGSAPGHHGHAGQLKARLFTTGYASGEKPWRLECTLPGWTSIKTRFTTEDDAYTFAEKVLARFTEKLLSSGEESK